MHQHTPRAVTAEPLSEVILPPQEAVVCVIRVTAEVVKNGKCNVGVGAGFGVGLLSFDAFLQPYASIITNPIANNGNRKILNFVFIVMELTDKCRLNTQGTIANFPL